MLYFYRNNFTFYELSDRMVCMTNIPHQLRNHISKEEALKKLSEESFSRRVISFYRYVIIGDPVALRNELFAEWQDLGCLGRIYVAKEGINAQMSVPEPNLRNFVNYSMRGKSLLMCRSKWG
jgi:UPF0176 protein